MQGRVVHWKKKTQMWQGGTTPCHIHIENGVVLKPPHLRRNTWKRIGVGLNPLCSRVKTSGVGVEPIVFTRQNEWCGGWTHLFAWKCIGKEWGGVETTPFMLNEVEREWGGLNPSHCCRNTWKRSGVELNHPVHVETTQNVSKMMRRRSKPSPLWPG